MKATPPLGGGACATANGGDSGTELGQVLHHRVELLRRELALEWRHQRLEARRVELVVGPLQNVVADVLVTAHARGAGAGDPTDIAQVRADVAAGAGDLLDGVASHAAFGAKQRAR